MPSTANTATLYEAVDQLSGTQWREQLTRWLRALASTASTTSSTPTPAQPPSSTAPAQPSPPVRLITTAKEVQLDELSRAQIIVAVSWLVSTHDRVTALSDAECKWLVKFARPSSGDFNSSDADIRRAMWTLLASLVSATSVETRFDALLFGGGASNTLHWLRLFFKHLNDYPGTVGLDRQIMLGAVVDLVVAACERPRVVGDGDVLAKRVARFCRAVTDYPTGSSSVDSRLMELMPFPSGLGGSLDLLLVFASFLWPSKKSSASLDTWTPETYSGVFDALSLLMSDRRPVTWLVDNFHSIQSAITHIGISPSLAPPFLTSLMGSGGSGVSKHCMSVTELNAFRRELASRLLHELVVARRLSDLGKLNVALQSTFFRVLDPLKVEIEKTTAMSPVTVAMLEFSLVQTSHTATNLGPISAPQSHAYLDTVMSTFRRVASKGFITNAMAARPTTAHNSRTAQSLVLTLAWTIRSVARSLARPKLSALLESLLSDLSKFVQLSAPAAEADYETVLCYGYLLSYLVPLTKNQEFALPPTLIDRVVSAAVALIKSSHRLAMQQYFLKSSSSTTDSKAALPLYDLQESVCFVRAGWMLLGSVLTLGGVYMRDAFRDSDTRNSTVLIQVLAMLKLCMFQLRKNGAFIISKEEKELRTVTSEGWVWAMAARESALTCLSALLNEHADVFFVKAARPGGELVSESTLNRLAAYADECALSVKSMPASVLEWFHSSSFVSIDAAWACSGGVLASSAPPGCTSIDLTTDNFLKNPFALPAGICNLARLKRQMYQCQYGLALARRQRHEHSSKPSSPAESLSLVRSLLDVTLGDVCAQLPSTVDQARLAQYYQDELVGNDGSFSVPMLMASQQAAVMVPLAKTIAEQVFAFNELLYVGDVKMTTLAAFGEHASSGIVGRMFERANVRRSTAPSHEAAELVALMSSEPASTPLLNVDGLKHRRSCLAFDEGAQIDEWSLAISPPAFLGALQYDAASGIIADSGESLDVRAPQWSPERETTIQLPRPLPPSLLLVDTMLEMAAHTFPGMDGTYQEILLDHILKTVKTHQAHLAACTGSLKVSVTRRLIKVQSNALTTLLMAMHHGKLATDGRCAQLVQQLCLDALASSFDGVRVLGGRVLAGWAECLRAKSPKSTATSDTIDLLLGITASSSKDPCLRAGSSYAVAAVISRLGAMSTTPQQLRNVFNVLASLARDGNVLVHAWALVALSMVLEVAGGQLLTALDGAAQRVMDACALVLVSAQHHPFWGAPTSGGVTPSIDRCPYRSVIKILTSLISAYGPELAMDSQGKKVAVGCRVLMDYAVREWVGRSIGSGVDRRVMLKHSLMTVASPVGDLLLADVFRAWHQYVAFNLWFVIDQATIVEVVAKWYLLPAKQYISPTTRRLALKLAWVGLMSGWEMAARSLQTPEFLEQCLYLLDVYVHSMVERRGADVEERRALVVDLVEMVKYLGGVVTVLPVAQRVTTRSDMAIPVIVGDQQQRQAAPAQPQQQQKPSTEQQDEDDDEEPEAEEPPADTGAGELPPASERLTETPKLSIATNANIELSLSEWSRLLMSPDVLLKPSSWTMLVLCRLVTLTLGAGTAQLPAYIKLSFALLSTHQSPLVRHAALNLLSVLISAYAPIPDPHIPESSVLEQYQAQILAGVSSGVMNDETVARAVEIAVQIGREVPSLDTSRVARVIGELRQRQCRTLGDWLVWSLSVRYLAGMSVGRTVDAQLAKDFVGYLSMVERGQPPQFAADIAIHRYAQRFPKQPLDDVIYTCVENLSAVVECLPDGDRSTLMLLLCAWAVKCRDREMAVRVHHRLFTSEFAAMFSWVDDVLEELLASWTRAIDEESAPFVAEMVLAVVKQRKVSMNELSPLLTRLPPTYRAQLDAHLGRTYAAFRELPGLPLPKAAEILALLLANADERFVQWAVKELAHGEEHNETVVMMVAVCTRWLRQRDAKLPDIRQFVCIAPEILANSDLKTQQQLLTSFMQSGFVVEVVTGVMARHQRDATSVLIRLLPATTSEQDRQVVLMLVMPLLLTCASELLMHVVTTYPQEVKRVMAVVSGDLRQALAARVSESMASKATTSTPVSAGASGASAAGAAIQLKMDFSFS